LQQWDPTLGSTAAVEVQCLTKTFPGTRALDNLSLSVERGEIHAIVGQNGSGKSTLIKILAGYHAPDPTGKVWVGGTEIVNDRAAKAHELGLRFVHQGLGLIDELDVIDNFGLISGFKRKKTGRLDWKKQVAHVSSQLSRFGIQVDVMKPVKELNAVERTAVAITRALEGLGPGSGALVLDEPTVALTKLEVEQLFTIIHEVQRSGVSVLYVSHYLDEIFDIANRVTVLKGGKLVGTSKIESITHKDLVHLMVGRNVNPIIKASKRAKGAPLLSVEHLTGAELKGIDFTVHSGEVVGIAGLQGSGIAECPYLLIGASTSKELSLTLDGRVMQKISPPLMARNGIHLVPGDRKSQGAISEFNVRENMTLGDLAPFRRHGHLCTKVEKELVEHWIGELDLVPPNSEHDYLTLSGGNQQKVIVAKWLAVNPKVLILDEPTNGVDIGAREKIYSVIRDQASRGLAFIICSSDAGELAELCDRILVLNDGKIISELIGEQVNEINVVDHLHAVNEQKTH